MTLLKTIFYDWWQVLSEPRKFFHSTFPHRSTTQALSFALIISWVASLVEWSVRVVKNETLMDGFLKVRDQLQGLPAWKGIAPFLAHTPESMNMMPGWAMELFAVLGNPFTTLLSLSMSSVMIWLGSLVLIGRTDVAQILKLFAYASTAAKLVIAFLSFLPLGLGQLIGGIWTLVIQMLALSTHFNISTGRAFGVIILPTLVLILVGSCILGLIIGTIGALLGSMF